jgi:hypothetical protein
VAEIRRWAWLLEGIDPARVIRIAASLLGILARCSMHTAQCLRLAAWRRTIDYNFWTFTHYLDHSSHDFRLPHMANVSSRIASWH